MPMKIRLCTSETSFKIIVSSIGTYAFTYVANSHTRRKSKSGSRWPIQRLRLTGERRAAAPWMQGLPYSPYISPKAKLSILNTELIESVCSSVAHWPNKQPKPQPVGPKLHSWLHPPYGDQPARYDGSTESIGSQARWAICGSSGLSRWVFFEEPRSTTSPKNHPPRMGRYQSSRTASGHYLLRAIQALSMESLGTIPQLRKPSINR